MRKLSVLGVWVALIAAVPVARGAESSRPETWFHMIGGNVSKAGLTADLEAIRDAGIGGIQLFHGSGDVWDGVTNQVPCLSAGWDDMVRHIGCECQRLGLTLTLQNCPGWSMSGGPWIDDRHSMRRLVMNGSGRDYQPICEVSVPAPAGERAGVQVPVSVVTNGDERVFDFGKPVVLRSLTLPSAEVYSHDYCYEPGLSARLDAKVRDGWRNVFDRRYPASNYSDSRFAETFSFVAVTAQVWRISIAHAHPIKMRARGPCAPVFSSAQRLENWQGLAGWSLREVTDASWKAVPMEREDGLVRLAFGHVNPEITNHPAPPEATGWECNKIDPAGIEANFRGYVARLLDGPLKGLPVKRILIDSWECGPVSWTDKMPQYFREINGYDLRRWLPALFGYIVDSPEATVSFLRDWRRTQGELVKENYYRRFAELAHERGLQAQYETAMGDVIAGDILAYWKYADVPMCEFWSPHDDKGGSVTSYEFKPVRPCVSASHIYGKGVVAAEAFTSFKLTWDETLADFKRDADRFFTRGITHLVFHTYAHNPRVGAPPPGPSFSGRIGSPFTRGQAWWGKMRYMTDYFARCQELLESGKPVVDILWYLGDDCGHKPSEKAPLPPGYKADYITYDALSSRAAAKDGRIVFPDGMSYSLLWVPDNVYLRPESVRRIAELEGAGAKVVRGDFAALARGLGGIRPDVSGGDLMWYHRRTEGEDIYFLVTESAAGFSGPVRLRTCDGPVALELPPYGSVFAHVRNGRVTLEDPSRTLPKVPTGTDVRKVGLDLKKMDFAAPFEDAPFRTYAASVRAEDGEGRRATVLDFGAVRGVLDVTVNGRDVGTLWCPPYSVDVSHLMAPGENKVEVRWIGTWRKRLQRDAKLPLEQRKTWKYPTKMD